MSALPPDDWYAPLPLFAYGTLRRALANHDRFCAEAVRIVPATLPARLYRMHDGYPAIVPDPDARVFGDLIHFDDAAAALHRIDPLEGFHPAGAAEPGVAEAVYDRAVLPASPTIGGDPVLAWCYIVDKRQVRSATEVRGGDWIAACGRGE